MAWRECHTIIPQFVWRFLFVLNPFQSVLTTFWQNHTSFWRNCCRFIVCYYFAEAHKAHQACYIFRFVIKGVQPCHWLDYGIPSQRLVEAQVSHLKGMHLRDWKMVYPRDHDSLSVRLLCLIMINNSTYSGSTLGFGHIIMTNILKRDSRQLKHVCWHFFWLRSEEAGYSIF